MGAFVNFGADVIEPGVVHYGGRGAVVLGELDGRMSDRLARVHDALRHFEPAAITTDNIWGYLWGKMGYGSLLFASALTNASIVDVLDSREARGVLTALAREVMAVAAAERVTVMGFNGYDPDGVRAGRHRAGGRRVVRRDGRVQPTLGEDAQRRLARHRRASSQDRDRRAVRAGAAPSPAGTASPTPHLDRLVSVMREVESGARPQAWENLARIGIEGRLMQIRFDGQTAIVTGAAHGFGRAIALRFARLGARVVGCDVVADELEETARLAGARGHADRRARRGRHRSRRGRRRRRATSLSAARTHRHSRQRRRRRAGPGRPADRGRLRGRLARHRRGEPRRRVLLQPGRRAGDEGGAPRPHRQHLQRRRPRRQPHRHSGVRVGQGGTDRPDAAARARTRRRGASR